MSTTEKLLGAMAYYMRAKHVSVDELSAALQMSSRTFRDRRRRPETFRLWELEDMARKLGTSVSVLIGGEPIGG